MEIIIAENTGLCYGVRRALTIVRRTHGAAGGPVATLGDLIHNPRVIADLERQGVRSVASPADVRGGTVVIRSHGVAPEVRRRLLRKKVEVVDATCPIVSGIQELVAGLARSGGEIVLVGNPGHPEVLGLLGYGRGRVVIVEDEAGARALPWRRARAVHRPIHPGRRPVRARRGGPGRKDRGAPRPQHHLPFRPDAPAGDGRARGPGGRHVRRRGEGELQYREARRDRPADPAPDLLRRGRLRHPAGDAPGSGDHRGLGRGVDPARGPSGSRGKDKDTHRT